MSTSSEPGEVKHFLAPLVASVRKRFQNLASRACAICAAFALLLCLIIGLRVPPFYDVLSDAELKLQDSFFLWRDSSFPRGDWKNASHDIVLVSAGNESARRLSLDENQSWPRTVYGALLKKLREAGAD